MWSSRLSPSLFFSVCLRPFFCVCYPAARTFIPARAQPLGDAEGRSSSTCPMHSQKRQHFITLNQGTQSISYFISTSAFDYTL
ncbi:hypothetical protein BDB00DRAFT_380801 [Zychaea mexicana]|uniref:uncharacterized protein n=1 Tax=Zychaea mexicana TaxID=64656 RepID=UPI0022FE0BDB|nr:uncharacterized protein BDB00DRAFT_380801 [Zychaea mexicana]KAI9493243.1 hypothetical protein BDB00DRAFT_380801 [Zychaea mexicana]